MLLPLASHSPAFKSQLFVRGLVDLDTQHTIAKREDVVGSGAAFREHDDIADFNVRVEELACDEIQGIHENSGIAKGAIARGRDFFLEGLLCWRGGEEE
jgi:hypothetical protein